MSLVKIRAGKENKWLESASRWYLIILFQQLKGTIEGILTGIVI